MEKENEQLEQSQAVNALLLEMVRNQRGNNKCVLRVFVIAITCYAVLLVAMVIGFFVYESQFEVTEQIVTEMTTTQEVSGENSEINNVQGNMYKDNATHNQGATE